MTQAYNPAQLPKLGYRGGKRIIYSSLPCWENLCILFDISPAFPWLNDHAEGGFQNE